jgi:hypothetical protein
MTLAGAAHRLGEDVDPAFILQGGPVPQLDQPGGLGGNGLSNVLYGESSHGGMSRLEFFLVDMYSAFFEYNFTCERSIKDTLQKRVFSSATPPQVLGVQGSAAIDPTSVLHKRRQLVARFLDAGYISQRSRPLADGLVVGLAIARATNYGGKRVSARINSQLSKLVRTPYESLSPSAPAVMFDNRKHGSQIPVDRITITSLLKIIPSIADIPEPLSN